MITERMEAYAIEGSDHIFVNNEIYRVIGITYLDSGYLFELVNEEGERARMEIGDGIKVPVIIDTLAEV